MTPPGMENWIELILLILIDIRHLLQPILLYRAGTDEARPVGADENNIHGI